MQVQKNTFLVDSDYICVISQIIFYTWHFHFYFFDPTFSHKRGCKTTTIFQFSYHKISGHQKCWGRASFHVPSLQSLLSLFKLWWIKVLKIMASVNITIIQKLLQARWKKLNKCNQCKFASTRAGNLGQHLEMHRGEKSNKCNQCNYICIFLGKRSE